MPKTITGGERELVLRVKAFCELEKLKKTPIIPLERVRSRVAAITGLSERTVTRIAKEGKIAAKTSSKLTTPGTTRVKEKQIKLEDFKLCALRHKIHEFYAVRKELPTLVKILNELRHEIDFKGSRTTLWRIMKELGFYFKKWKSKRSILLEKHDIVVWRCKYLNEMKKIREAFRPVVYLDETCVQINKGTRCVVIHAGGEMGFIPNAQLIFKTEAKSSEGLDDMNQKNFTVWFEQKLLPNLPQRSVVVMDNASYHALADNKCPTMASTIAEMQAWLTAKGLAFQPNMVKAELFEIVKEHKAPVTFEFGGHTVLTLPPYHCDLNPLELIWVLLKTRVAEKSGGEESKNIMEITEEVLSAIKEEEWRKVCNHVKCVEEKYCYEGLLVDTEIDRFISEVRDEPDTSRPFPNQTIPGNVSGGTSFNEHHYY